MWGAGDFGGGIAARRSNVFGVVLVAHLAGAALMSALAWLAHDPALTWKAFWWCIAAGISNGIAIVCLYRALAVGKMGLTAPVAAVLTAVLPVLAGIRSQGLPSVFQMAGFALAFVAIWLIAKPEGAAGRPQGLGLAILAGIGFSGFLLMIRLANTPAIFWPVAAVRISSVTLVCAVIIFQRSAWLPRQNSFWIAALAGCFDALGSTFFLLGAQLGRLDVAAVLASLYPASTVLLARFLLREHLTRLQQAGMLAALIAVPLIATK